MDGETWFRVTSVGAGYQIESNASQEVFERYFRLDWSAADVERRILKLAPELGPAMGELRGLRVLRPSDPVEVFYSFLCTPNNHLPRIIGMVNHLASHGQPLGETGLHVFPGSELISSLDEGELRRSMFGYRGATIPAAAGQVLERGGDDYIRSLKGTSYPEAFAELLTIRGIGPKLADCICLFGLDKTEAVPVDTHIWQAATRLFFPQWAGLPLTGQRYRAVGEALRDRFGELAGWLQQYLFYENLRNWRARRKAINSGA